VYGLSAEEVGQILGMKSEAVMMALSRARAQFRQLYLQEERQL
jgi:DNA-directed RNA polymerase specialized sigma24 family protein